MCIRISIAFISTAASVLLLTSTHVYANQKDTPIQLTSRAEVELMETNSLGEPGIKRVPATRVIPGKDVIYTLTIENVGTEPGDAVVIQNPVPEHTRYKPDTASGNNTRISFSIDGGQNFASPGQLTVTEPDGSTRLATASEYTTIRWQYQKPLQPGAKTSVEFRVVLQ